MSTKKPIVFNFLLLIFIFFLLSCEKENAFKNPCKFSVRINLQYDGIGPSDDLILDDGFVLIEEIRVVGQRPDAEDFEFVRLFEQALEINADTNLIYDEFVFDLPQGTYSSLKIEFKTLSDSINTIIKGNYNYPNPSKPPSKIHYTNNNNKSFSLELTDTLNNELLRLSEYKEMMTVIKFDPLHWFRNIPIDMLNNANFDLMNGEQIIHINDSSNIDMHTIIDSATGQNISVLIH